MTLLAESTPRARKPHPCALCWMSINPGVTYINQRIADGGQVYTYKAHQECHRFYWHDEWYRGMDGELPDPIEFRQAMAGVSA